MTSATNILGVSNRKNGYLRTSRDHFIDKAVFHSLFGPNDEVTVGVLCDALHRLTGVVGQHFIEHVLHPKDLTGLDFNVRGLSADAAPWLMEQDTSVGQGETLAFRARTQKDCGCRCGLSETKGRHRRLDVLHRVVDREQTSDVATR